MLTVEEARERVLARFQPLEAEQAPLAEALGRVLVTDTLASEASPPFTNSAMDGYALRSADTRDAASKSLCGCDWQARFPQAASMTAWRSLVRRFAF